MQYTITNTYKNKTYYTRILENVIPYLSEKGQIKAYDMAGVKILYNSPSTAFNLEIEIEGEGYCSLYVNNLSVTRISLTNGKNVINYPLHERFINLFAKKDNNFCFKVLLESNYKLKEVKILDEFADATNISQRNVVLYGSSFTQGVGAFAYPYCYANILGELLNINILNKALSGSCLCEKEMVDYLATLNPDFYIFELGCNMRGVMDEKEFAKRIEYLFKTIKTTNKKVFIISSLDFFVKEFAIFKNPPYHERNILFVNILKELAEKYGYTLISMTKLMTKFENVSYDMLHPSITGHLNIAYNLASILKTLI